MALTPDDIVNHEFRQTMRGYAVAEVDDLLDRLADQVERNERDLAELRQRLEADAAKLTEAQRNETALTQTLITAQQTAQRTVQDAEERATIILADAQAQADERNAEAEREAAATTDEAIAAAERMRAATEQEREAIRGRLEELVTIERAHRADLRAHLERQLALLDGRDDGPGAQALRAGDGVDDGAVPQDVQPLGDDIVHDGGGDLLDATSDGADHDGPTGPGDGDVTDDHAESGHEQHHAHGG